MGRSGRHIYSVLQCYDSIASCIINSVDALLRALAEMLE